jgi:selenocysteine lyase/cysteine desulfurase
MTMISDRRRFLKSAGTFGLSAAAGRLILPEVAESVSKAHERIAQLNLTDQVRDEDFWHIVKQAYTTSATILNLNNGGVSPQPLVVQEAVERYNRLSNEAPSHYMWHVLDKGREPLRGRMADLAGCSAEELAFDRNSSEALETIIFGIRLAKGAEVALNKLDYPNMINAWRQRAHREGIVLKWIEGDFPNDDKSEIVEMYVSQFTSKTKVVHITHVINWMGQILPAREIADEAKKKGIEVLVDGAHSFAHLNFKIPDLNCDYFGTSLHKWLCAPFGSGLLYVKKDKIKNLYPLLAAPDPEDDSIRKFEHLGTRSFAIEQAIGQALDFHLMIGSERKHQRLHYLKSYWCEKVKDLPGVSIGTPLDIEFSGALALLKIDGFTPQEVSKELMTKYGIHTVAIVRESVYGVRVTPNVYTLTKDLDRLISAIRQMVS